jgi:hypothetical protein
MREVVGQELINKIINERGIYEMNNKALMLTKTDPSLPN